MDVYTIWWAQEVGWYPTEQIDPRFVLAHAVGRIGIFNCMPTFPMVSTRRSKKFPRVDGTEP